MSKKKQGRVGKDNSTPNYRYKDPGVGVSKE